MATAKKLGLSPERTELPVSGGETEFFADGEEKKPVSYSRRGRVLHLTSS
jgi:hypothetical protein